MKETEKVTDTRMFENVVVVGGNTLANGFIGKMSELANGPLQDIKVRIFGVIGIRILRISCLSFRLGRIG
jgi:hypothetical protein